MRIVYANMHQFFQQQSGRKKKFLKKFVEIEMSFFNLFLMARCSLTLNVILDKHMWREKERVMTSTSSFQVFEFFC